MNLDSSLETNRSGSSASGTQHEERLAALTCKTMLDAMGGFKHVSVSGVLMVREISRWAAKNEYDNVTVASALRDLARWATVTAETMEGRR